MEFVVGIVGIIVAFVIVYLSEKTKKYEDEAVEKEIKKTNYEETKATNSVVYVSKDKEDKTENSTSFAQALKEAQERQEIQEREKKRKEEQRKRERQRENERQRQDSATNSYFYDNSSSNTYYSDSSSSSSSDSCSSSSSSSSDSSSSCSYD